MPTRKMKTPSAVDAELIKTHRIYKDMTKEGIRLSFIANREYTLAKDRYTATLNDDYLALALAVRDRVVARWIITQQRYHDKNLKRVYYFSLEFLIGRLLGTNIINLGLWNQVQAASEEIGLELDKVRDCESDAGLGNGGLGRLAACFLDSMATLRIPAHGYGIRYEYGIFNQKIVNGSQVEYPDEWLRNGNPWEFPRPEYTIKIRFYGRSVMTHDRSGRLVADWVDTDDVLATPYDIPVVGFKNDIVNTLRLWSARSTEEFDLSYFNDGDYERAVYSKVLTENISKVLYPNDNVSQGRELRLKQEYFFTAASLADIIRRFKMENRDLADLPNKAAIQLNDTHPAISIAELMRILVDEEGLDWDTAWAITTRVFAYTNHTIMPEALESWPVPLFEHLLPRHLQIIYEINMRFLKLVAARYPGDNELLRRMSIIEEGSPKRVRMAHLSVVGSHRVNGVSELHSELLRTRLFKDFAELWPEKFTNVTNGITQRRWLMKANMPLAALITGAIGPGWETDLYKLRKLGSLAGDRAFGEKWRSIKEGNKKHLARLIREMTGVVVDPASLFDVQVKRMHEYKRQLLFCLYILDQYLRLKRDPASVTVPRTCIFSGKAAPGYSMAKLVIRFINALADTINNDPAARGKLAVVFLENYRVSLAERIFPASDLSEQISTAGTEASGTGCMKFMLNGALTIGTRDGANLEIAREVGDDNIFLFGLTADEVARMRRTGYDPRRTVARDPALTRIVDLIHSNFLSPAEFDLFDPIVSTLTGGDYFMVTADFASYCRTQAAVDALYREKGAWTKKAIINVSRSGKFSSDRSIGEYAASIWDVPVMKG